MKMTKLLGLSAVAVLAMTALPAMADVTVTATVDKAATNTTTDTVNSNREYDVLAKQQVSPTNSSEADAVKNQDNSGNQVGQPSNGGTNPFGPIDDQNTASITDDGSGNGSFDGATGIVGVNQSPGNLNNQGNAASVAMTAVGNAIVRGNSSDQQVNGLPSGATGSEVPGNVLNAQGETRNDEVMNSFTGAAGVFGVNQASGHMNNQDNAVSVSLGLNAVASLAEADLGQTATAGQINDSGSTNTDTISGAFGTVSGVVSVNQSSGSLNNQSNTVSIAATAFPAPAAP